LPPSRRRSTPGSPCSTPATTRAWATTRLLLREALHGRTRERVVLSVKFGLMRAADGSIVGNDLRPESPARPGSVPESSTRPVTPEVAGSSPVAPVNSLQISIFCCLSRRERPPASIHPAHIPHGNPRTKPAKAANSGNLLFRPLSRRSALKPGQPNLLLQGFLP
jgi:hypothetical protein